MPKKISLQVPGPLPKASSINPLFDFVPAKGKTLEEEKVGDADTSTPKGKEDPLASRLS
jgi:hypothetical protein